VYLDGTEFKVITDHKALKWLLNFKNNHKRLYRWSNILSLYTFTVEHREGSKMEHVDALSRAPIESVLASISFKDQTLSIETIKDWQTKANLQITKPFKLKNGIIGRQYKQQFKPVIPKQFVNEFMIINHEQAGHPGIKRTIKNICQKYFWNKMLEDIKLHIKTCKTCQLVKPSNHPTYGPLTPLTTPDNPNELWAMDTIVMGSSARNTKAKYIQVLIDHHSRFVWAKATKVNTTQAIIEMLKPILEKQKPKRLLTDNGSNFKSRVLKRFLDEYQIKQSFTSTYHPQTNGHNEK